jgi:hypothetical protein
MTFVSCSCGVQLLYRRLPEGPDLHWSKADVRACKALQVTEDGKPSCAEIERLITADYEEWKKQLGTLRGPLRSRLSASSD